VSSANFLTAGRFERDRPTGEMVALRTHPTKFAENHSIEYSRCLRKLQYILLDFCHKTPLWAKSGLQNKK